MNKELRAGTADENSTNDDNQHVSPACIKPNVMRRFYWLRRFRFARKKIGGAWIKTKWRGWITYQTFIRYNDYGFDPVALMSEQDGEIRWVASPNGA